MQERERAAYEVQLHEAYVGALLSIHKDCSDPWDWEAIRSAPPPVRPEGRNVREKAALNALGRFRPGVRDRLVQGTDYPVPPTPIVWPLALGPLKAIKLQLHKCL